jgi:hypothetical protein
MRPVFFFSAVARSTLSSTAITKQAQEQHPADRLRCLRTRYNGLLKCVVFKITLASIGILAILGIEKVIGHGDKKNGIRYLICMDLKTGKRLAWLDISYGSDDTRI